MAIGLQAVEKLQGLIGENPDLFDKKHLLHLRIEPLMRYTPLSEIIEKFWLERKNREASSWTEHRDINMVMLATSLAPDAGVRLFNSM